MDLDYLSASDGSGDAALAHVSAIRTTGSTTLEVDSVNAFPQKFIGTYGTLLPSGLIDPTTKVDFLGHLSGADIEIDAFEPGNPDAGNIEGQVVIIKPTTGWADRVAAALQNFTGLGDAVPIVASTLAVSGPATVGGTLSVAGPISGNGFSLATIHNPSKFSVWRSAGYTVGSPTYPVMYDEVLYDTGGEYDIATGLFTANQDGFYHFEARGAIVGGGYHGNGVGISLSVNGASYKEGDSFIMAYDNWETGVRVSGGVQLSAGDTVGVSFYGSGLPGQTTNQVYTWFEGELRSKT